MNKTTLRVIISVLVIILLIPCLGFAQDKEKEDTPYWYASFGKMNFARMDSLESLYKEYIIPIVAEAKKSGGILDYKLLFHHTGDEYNVVFMTKHPSWCSMEKLWMSTAYKAIEPDKGKRKVFWDAWWWVFEGATHYDCIYTEL